MKKIVHFIVAIILSFALPITASAISVPVQTIPATEHSTAVLPSGDIIAPWSLVKTFAPKAGSATYLAECVVTQGKTELYIEDCTWYPANSIRIGFRHITNHTEYGVSFTNGSVEDFTITTEYVPDGSYWIFIRNEGDIAIGSGVIYYQLNN